MLFKLQRITEACVTKCRKLLDNVGGVSEFAMHILYNFSQLVSEIKDFPAVVRVLGINSKGPTNTVLGLSNFNSVPNLPKKFKSGFCSGPKRILSPKS